MVVGFLVGEMSLQKSSQNSLRSSFNRVNTTCFVHYKKNLNIRGRDKCICASWNSYKNFKPEQYSTSTENSLRRIRYTKLPSSQGTPFFLPPSRYITTSSISLKGIDIESKGEDGNPYSSLGKGQYLEIEGYAKIDYKRAKRTGLPEAIFGEGKTADQILGIFAALKEKWNESKGNSTKTADSSPVIGTRISAGKYNEMQELIKIEKNKYGLLQNQLHYYRTPGIVILKSPNTISSVEDSDSASISVQDLVGRSKETPPIGAVAVLSAGTSDLPMAEEAAIFAEASGCQVYRVHDVGVAGLHRLLNSLPKVIDKVSVIICVAGMDGALPTVVSGLVEAPVIALPTSVGYGVTFNGITPLLTMLNGCAPGMAVVNIDNGFGAAAMAVKIIKSKDIVKS